MNRIDPRVIHVIRLMEEHRASPWPVHRLARAVNVSPSHLTRLFRAHLRISPAQYDKHARLANARDLILTSVLPLREIMAAVGWADADHFGRQFKRRYGASPHALRTASVAERRAASALARSTASALHSS